MACAGQRATADLPSDSTNHWTEPDRDAIPKGDADEVVPGLASIAKVVRIKFRANAARLFRILPALQNLADRSAKFTVTAEVEAEGKEPFDPTWLRNAVSEHLDEAGVDAESRLE